MTVQDSQDPELPEAKILPTSKRSYSAASIAALIPIIAIIFSAWYLVRAWDERGLEITVHFEDGHGIKAGDNLRFRGISVGRVEKVALSTSLEGVNVHLKLMESSRPLARTGSRFWVVRPQVEFDSISGLDTVLGAHYLNVAPGPTDGALRQYFNGLDGPPMDIAPGSLELVLEAKERGAARRGSPVTWRRTPVGIVLAAELSSDARVVEVRIAIEPRYASLVLENSRFFEIGGLAIDVGLSGMHLEVDSLRSLFTGGVAFATPEKGGKPVESGARFSLYSEPKDDWLEWRPALAVGADAMSEDAALVPVKAELSWEQGFFGRDKQRQGWLLWFGPGLLGPADLMRVPEGAGEGVMLRVDGNKHEITAEHTDDSDVAIFAIASPPSTAPAPWPKARLRRPTEPEDCLATGPPDMAPLPLSIGQLSDGSLPWVIDDDMTIDELWHGAAVTSRATGDLVGFLLVDQDGAKIVGLPTALLP